MADRGAPLIGAAEATIIEAETPMAKRYTVNDGKLLLTLQPMKEGGFLVRSPMDPEILTSATTISEAFEKAYDVQKALRVSRQKRVQRQRAAG
jgi:hypothetical protein